MCLDVFCCCVFVQVVRDFHPPPAVLFRGFMHTYASVGNHCHICLQSWNPWLLTPSPTHLGKKKRQQDRVLCMTVVDWGEADLGKSHVRKYVMWLWCGNIMNSADELMREICFLSISWNAYKRQRDFFDVIDRKTSSNGRRRSRGTKRGQAGEKVDAKTKASLDLSIKSTMGHEVMIS